MKRSKFVDVYRIPTVRNRSWVPMDSDQLSTALRSLASSTDSSYESCFVSPSTQIAHPLVVDIKTCVPYYNGIIVPTTQFERLDNGIHFLPAHFAGAVVELRVPSLGFGVRPPRSDNVFLKPDSLNAHYLKLGNRFIDRCPTWTPMRIGPRYQFNPEKIARDYLGDSELWWVVLQYNGLLAAENLALDSVIRIPNRSELNAYLKSSGPSQSFTSAMQYRGRTIRI